jgi:hypothetical protein
VCHAACCMPQETFRTAWGIHSPGTIDIALWMPRAGLMFLTRLPCPGWCDHHPAYLMRSMAYFPLFGALVGAWGAVFFQAASVLWPASIAAGASTLATVWLTGASMRAASPACQAHSLHAA